MTAPVIGVVVSSVRILTPRIREFLLRSTDGRALPAARPGCHIELHIAPQPAAPMVRHYSVLGGIGLADDPPDTYRIAIQREDHQRGSAYMHGNVDPGTKLMISYPKNNFPLSYRDSQSLLIAGGIGITPTYSMLRSLVRRRRSFRMIYLGRTPDQLAYFDDVSALAGNALQLHFSGDPTVGRLDMTKVLREQPTGTTVYVCGSGPMIEAVYKAAHEVGWDKHRVRSEKFVAASMVGDEAFDVELRRSVRKFAVGKDTSILDALIAGGVDVLSDCRRGECGLCPLPVFAADGPLLHRDRYLSRKEREGGKTMCICVSRIAGKHLVLDF